jgi:hypothetical protein
MFRLIHPADRQELPLRMLFHPAEDGIFFRACEADSFRGLVAALLDDAGYEKADVSSRLLQRLRLASDVALISALRNRQVRFADVDDAETINVRSDEPLIRSLDRLGFVALHPHSPNLEARLTAS